MIERSGGRISVRTPASVPLRRFEDDRGLLLRSPDGGCRNKKSARLSLLFAAGHDQRLHTTSAARRLCLPQGLRASSPSIATRRVPSAGHRRGQLRRGVRPRQPAHGFEPDGLLMLTNPLRNTTVRSRDHHCLETILASRSLERHADLRTTEAKFGRGGHSAVRSRTSSGRFGVEPRMGRHASSPDLGEPFGCVDAPRLRRRGAEAIRRRLPPSTWWERARPESAARSSILHVLRLRLSPNRPKSFDAAEPLCILSYEAVRRGPPDSMRGSGAAQLDVRPHNSSDGSILRASATDCGRRRPATARLRLPSHRHSELRSTFGVWHFFR